MGYVDFWKIKFTPFFFWKNKMIVKFQNGGIVKFKIMGGYTNMGGYRNMGGFDMIRAGRHKIETDS